MNKPHHIVVLGAGFAGLMAAIRLSRKSQKYPMKITLINGSEDYIVRPRLQEWATNQTRERQKIKDILAGTGVEFIKAWVKDLQPQDNCISFETDSGLSSLSYDSLIVAIGIHIDTSAVEGVRDYAYVYDAHAERGAEALRQKLLEYEHTSGKVVVIGGGATGIEGATHIKSLYPHLDVTIITREQLGSFKDDARVEREIQAAFAEQSIHVRDNCAVQAINVNEVRFSDNDTLPFDICIWAGGFCAPELGAKAGLEVNTQNQILIDPFQRAIGYPNIIAVGDCAFPIEIPGNPYRMCCPVALTMGAHAADNLIRRLAGKAEKPLSFDHYGQDIQLGIHEAISWITYPDDTVRMSVTRGKFSLIIRKMILAGIDVVFDYEKKYGIYNWVGKNRYEKNKSKALRASKKFSESTI